MATYTLSPVVVKKKKVRLVLSQLFSPILISGIFFYSWYSMENKENFWPLFGDAIRMIAFILPVYSIYIVHKGFKRLNTYQVTITDTTLMLDMYNQPTRTVSLSDITNITIYPNRIYRLQCKDSRSNIILSADLENETAFEAELNNISPMNQAKSKRSRWVSIMFIIAIALGIYGNFFNNLYAKYAFVIFMASFALWYAIQLLRSKHTTANRKTLIYVVIILVLINFIVSYFILRN